MSKACAVLVVFIIIGCLSVYRTWDRMQNACIVADWGTPTNWYNDAPCKTLAEAIPDARIDTRGMVQLPGRIIYLEMPICEFSTHEIYGQGVTKTIIKRTHP
jgi:hypothetical protein